MIRTGAGSGVRAICGDATSAPGMCGNMKSKERSPRTAAALLFGELENTTVIRMMQLMERKDEFFTAPVCGRQGGPGRTFEQRTPRAVPSRMRRHFAASLDRRETAFCRSLSPCREPSHTERPDESGSVPLDRLFGQVGRNDRRRHCQGFEQA